MRLLCEVVIKCWLWNGALRVGLAYNTASWQMLRHASVWEPAGGGRGRKDAVATQHRLTHQSIMLHVAEKKPTIHCNMTTTEYSGKVSIRRHPRLKGEWFILCRVMLRKKRFRSTFRERCLPHIAPCRFDKALPHCFPTLGSRKRGGSFTPSRCLIISCSASCKPEHGHPHSLRCHPHHGTTCLVFCSASMRIIWRDHLATLSYFPFTWFKWVIEPSLVIVLILTVLIFSHIISPPISAQPYSLSV